MDVDLGTRLLPGNRAVLQVRGSLNAATAPLARARIDELVAQGRVEIVFDLGQVTFLDSSGLAALVSGMKAARERGGFLRLVGLNEQVAEVLRRTMLDHVFEIHPSVEAALA